MLIYIQAEKKTLLLGGNYMKKINKTKIPKKLKSYCILNQEMKEHTTFKIGGKVKYFEYRPLGVGGKVGSTEYFAYQAKAYPKWADNYAPIAKDVMFNKFTLAPFNRILESIKVGTLNLDGSIQLGLF